MNLHDRGAHWIAGAIGALLFAAPATAFGQDCNWNGIPDEAELDRHILSAALGQQPANSTFAPLAASDGEVLIGRPEDGAYGHYAGAAALWSRGACGWAARHTFRPPEPTSNGRFGRAVALQGDRAFIAEHRPAGGLVHAFVRSQDGAWSWSRTISDPNGQSDGEIGAVHVDGNWLAISAPWRDRPDLVDAGVVNLYEFDGQEWVFRQRVVAPEETAGAQFGYAMQLSGDRLFVGAPYGPDPNQPEWPRGVAYVFQRSESAWSLADRIGAAADGGWEFAASVDWNGSRLAIGTGQYGYFLEVYEPTESGFVRIARGEDVSNGFWDGEDLWALTEEGLTRFAVADPDLVPVEVLPRTPHDNAWILSCAFLDRHLLTAAVGGEPASVRVFTRGADADDNGILDECEENAGTQDCQGNFRDDECELGQVAPTGQIEVPELIISGVGFALGAQVALQRDWLLVGATGDDTAGQDAGAVRAYQYVNGRWVLRQLLVADDAAPDRRLGTAVVMRDDWAAASDYLDVASNSTYLFQRVGGVWVQRQKITHSGLSAVMPAIYGKYLVLALPGVDRAYVYQLQDGVWLHKQTLGANGNHYGCGVALDADELWLGAPDDGDGVIKVFRLAGSKWTLHHRIDAPPGANDFGRSVAWNGERLAVGSQKGLSTFERAGDGWTLAQVSESSDPMSRVTWIGSELWATRLAVDAPIRRFLPGAGPIIAELEPLALPEGQPSGASVASNGAQIAVLAQRSDQPGAVVRLFEFARDCDGNGLLDSCDIASGAEDVNGDDQIDACQCIGDLNADQFVDDTDLAVLLSGLGEPGPDAAADVDDDGDCDLDDLLLMLARSGEACF